MKKTIFCFALLSLLFFSCETTYTDYYKVSVDTSVVGGQIKISSSQFRVGHMVDIELLPNPGRQYVTDSLCYYTAGGTRYGIHGTRFHMPDSDITLFCKFDTSTNATILEVRKPGDKIVENGSSVHFVSHMQLTASVIQGGMVLSNVDLEWSASGGSISVDKKTGRITAPGTDNSTATITAKLANTTDVLFSVTANSYPASWFSASVGGTGIVENIPLNTISATTSINKFYIPDCISGVAVVAIQAASNQSSVFGSDSNSENRNKILELYLPSTITSIGKSAFYGLASLQSVTCYAAKPPQLAVDAFAGCGSNFIIRVPSDQVEAYKVAVNSSDSTEWAGSSAWSVYADCITGLDTYAIYWGTIRGSNKEGVIMDADVPVITNPGKIALTNQVLSIDTSAPDVENSSHPNRVHPLMAYVTAGERIFVSLLPAATQQYAPEEEKYRLNWTTSPTDMSYKYADAAHGYTSFVMPEHDIFLNCTFRWAKTDIALNLNGGFSPTTSVSATYGSPITFNRNDRPLKVGYIFEGYFLRSNGSNGVERTSYCNQSMGSTNTWYSNSKTAVLHAEWVPFMATLQLNAINAENQTVYTVRATYGEDMPPVLDVDGSPVALPERDGHEFTGFMLENGVMYYDQALRSIRKWDQGGSVTHNDDGTYTQEAPLSSYMLIPNWKKE